MNNTNTWSDSDYCRTYTGKIFYPAHPESLPVDIVHIANSLGKVCRYNGDLEYFYSVAQHSVLVEQVLVSRLTDPESPDSRMLRLQALLHDASEAYLPDMPSPIKKLLPDFKELENKVQHAVFKYFNLPSELHPYIKEIDTKIRLDEIHCMTSWPEGEKVGPYNLLITPLDWSAAINLFFNKYYEITNTTR